MSHLSVNHLLGIKQLTKNDNVLILSTAKNFKEVVFKIFKANAVGEKAAVAADILKKVTININPKNAINKYAITFKNVCRPDGLL